MFVAWAEKHAKEPCPALAAFAPQALDPWGHPYRVTCSDQSADQMIGLISDGPDGAAKTADDIASWQLGDDVTQSVRGARWSPKVVAKTHPAVNAKPKSKGTSGGTGIELDENGLPIKR